MKRGMVPFVLRGRKPLPPEAPLNADFSFHAELQLWINRTTGRPVVSEYVARTDSTNVSSGFGETITTRSREGVDQTEGVRASDLGETICTKTQEGTDKTERAADASLEDVSVPVRGSFLGSKFGETIITMTREGKDQGEGSRS